MHESYLEQNPFSEVPCSSCGTLIPVDRMADAEVPSPEQRSEKRCPVTLKVSYKSYDQFIDEYTKNVSRRGMFIRTKRPHKLRDIVELLLHVPGLPDPVRISGEVAHVNLSAPREEDCGIGIKFIDIDDQSRNALIGFIRDQENCI